MEDLLACHRQQQKELQSKVTSKKKNATKKTRKGVNSECERLEQDLHERQQSEIAALARPNIEDGVAELDLNEAGEDKDTDNPVAEKVKVEPNGTIAATRGQQPELFGDALSAGKKPNRQKARLARRAAEQEAQTAAAAEEAASMPDQRKQEIAAMKQQMEKRRLAETQVRPDGHCLYSACALNLNSDSKASYKTIRGAAADYMNSHSDDFAPFMEEPIESYTRKIKDTAEWGGHLELQAIAKAFGVNICVLQSNGHVETIKPESSVEKDIWLAYYKHSFGLGEHYNALTKSAAD